MDPAPKSTSDAAAFGVLRGKEQTGGAAEILFGCRPYEFGWFLYAVAQPGSKARQAQTDGSSAL